MLLLKSKRNSENISLTYFGYLIAFGLLENLKIKNSKKFMN